MKKILLLGAALLVAVAALAEDWNDAKYADLVAAIEAENYAEALNRAATLHNEGDTIGSYTLGAMLLCGVGCDRDYKMAIQVLRPLAAASDERAQYMLGGIVALETTFKPVLKDLSPEGADDVDDNALWYQMMSLGRKNNGKPSEDFRGVFDWIKTPLREVVWGDIMHSVALTCFYGVFGEGHDQDGYKWLKRSADSGFEPAQNMLREFALPEDKQ